MAARGRLRYLKTTSRFRSILDANIRPPLETRSARPPLQKPPRESLSRLRHTLGELPSRTPTPPFPTRGQQCLHGRNPSIRFTNLKAKRPECFPFLRRDRGRSRVSSRNDRVVGTTAPWSYVTWTVCHKARGLRDEEGVDVCGRRQATWI